MISPIPPALIYIIGALLIPVIRIRRAQQLFALLIPAAAFGNLLSIPHGIYWQFEFLGHELILGRVDALSMVFAYIFVIASFISMVYAIHIKQMGQHTAAYLYVGSTLGVVLAGDLLSLFVFWEIMAISSVLLIWFRNTKASSEAGFRYILVHMTGGCILLAGIILHVNASGSLLFVKFDFQTIGAKLILVGFLINAAVPPFHAWLADAYPEGTITGSIFMTAFTTKSAVYVLARSFPGLELLIWLGAIMALYGVVYAVIENDIRRLLAYHIISQVGYMVCGVGLGTEMAINGAGAHAFCHVLYKAVLFMGAGAVIHVTGRNKMTELQGHDLFRLMPITLTLYMIGAFSISAVPLFNGYVSKTMIVAAAGADHRPSIELLLHLASIGTFMCTGLKLPWGVWFGTRQSDEDIIPNATEPPLNMLIAMGLGAFLCILTGIYPAVLYRILPYPVDFHPYKVAYVVAMVQLLLATLAAFIIYIRKLDGEPAINVDTDWFYRRSGRFIRRFCETGLEQIRIRTDQLLSEWITILSEWGHYPYQWIDLLTKSPSRKNKIIVHRIPIGSGACLSLVLLSVLILIGLTET